jgi:magnesium transporter
MYYLLKNSLEPCTLEGLGDRRYQYAAVLTPEEWQAQQTIFDMGIELEPDVLSIHSTKAEVNYDSLTGSFLLPDRRDLTGSSTAFAFALDEKGVVFIDASGRAEELLERIRQTKRWREPSLERFLYDLLELIVSGDLSLMESWEQELDRLEDRILEGTEVSELTAVNEIRSQVRELQIHYDQLVDLVQELEENENGFFRDKRLRYFRLSMNRMERLHDLAASLRDHTMQLRDLYHTQLEARQNRIMTLLTVVTTIFMPLTLIAGWYGMNFRYMPELNTPWGYPAVIALSVIIAAGCLWFFKKKKWL